MPSLNFGFQSKICIHWKWLFLLVVRDFFVLACAKCWNRVLETQCDASVLQRQMPCIAWPSLAQYQLPIIQVGLWNPYDIPWHFHKKSPLKNHISNISNPHPFGLWRSPKKLSKRTSYRHVQTVRVGGGIHPLGLRRGFCDGFCPGRCCERRERRCEGRGLAGCRPGEQNRSTQLSVFFVPPKIEVGKHIRRNLLKLRLDMRRCFFCSVWMIVINDQWSMW